MKKPSVYIGCLEEETDPPDWSASSLSDPLPALADAGLRTAVLTIAPLRAGWRTALPDAWYRSGAGPVEALRDAARAVRGGYFDAVLIRGEEPLRTGYTREERHKLMAIYPGATIPEAYEALTREFCRRMRWSGADFRRVADALWENYRRTACASTPVEGKWLCEITPSQRGIDCANPLVDWRGQLLVMNAAAAKVAGSVPARLAGVGFEKLGVDGPDHAARIARFEHLERAISVAESEAGEAVIDLLAAPGTAVELYTCYPVVPAAFLAASGIAATPEEAVAFLASRPVTLTGGMNLARAPWNLPALRALIRVGRAVGGGAPRGLAHGNGGVGYAQGVAVLAPP